ncbi:MAG: hypothetical protein QOH25_2598 [Acidobacteriota bacterium]|jgi:uncharacterized protein (DUF885 family)|nr:hypothetical protein [Acidobacteriota bacterium]
MKRKLSVLLLMLSVLVSMLLPSMEVAAQRRRRPVPRNFPPASSSSAYVTARFNKIADDYLKGYYSFNPTRATAAGLHEYDSQLETRSREAVARETRRLRETISLLTRINPLVLPEEARYDYLVLASHARGQLLELQDIRTWQRDPNLYNRLISASVDNILKRNYAPIEQRLNSVLAREREIARLLNEARDNLDAPPRIYTETAIAQVRGSIDYFSRVVPQMIERAGGGQMSAARKTEFETANGNVISALRAFTEWLEHDLSPRSTGNFAVGAENYRRKLLYDEMVETPIHQLIADGERELRRTQEEMRALAEEIAPGRGIVAALRALGRDHPSADGLVGDTRAELDRIRAFVRTENILTPPARENLTVNETPEYARSTSFASMDSPGAFERVATEAYYYVTPPDAEWDERKKDEHLSFYNRYALPIISIHEVYPGHYYQYLALKRSSSRVRAALSSASFTEGWGHYCEQMLLDEGFGGNNPKLRLAQLNLALLRLCRYLVGLRLHTAGMTYEQGVDFFMREGYQERVNAEREARRGTLDPTYLVYTLGKMQILKLREDYHARLGDAFSLNVFHDRLLSYGMPPVKIIRLAMLGEASADIDANSNNAVEPQRAVDFSVLATGYNSRYEGGRYLQLITNQNDWSSAWDIIGRGSTASMPEVNFNTRAVVIAYQGRKNTGGYGISVAEIRREGTALIVRVNEQRPQPGDMVTEALTSPFVAVSIPRPPEGVSVKFDGEVNKIEQNRNVKERSSPPQRRRRRGRRG